MRNNEVIRNAADEFHAIGKHLDFEKAYRRLHKRVTDEALTGKRVALDRCMSVKNQRFRLYQVQLP